MGQFSFVIVEKNWQDAYSNFDDDEVMERIEELYQKGYSREQITENIVAKLIDDCWNDVDYGDVFDSETVDTDYGTPDDDNVYHVVDDMLDKFYQENDDSYTTILGRLDDD